MLMRVIGMSNGAELKNKYIPKLQKRVNIPDLWSGMFTLQVSLKDIPNYFGGKMDKRFKQNIILRSLGVILLLSIFTMAIKSPTAAITYAQEGNTATPTVVSTLDTTLIECVLHKVDAHFSEITVDVVVSDIKMDGNWAFGIVVIKATTLNDSPALFLFNAYHEKTGWIVALEMEEMFNVFLNQIPVSLVSIESKQFMVREADNGEYHQLAGNEEAQLSLPWDTGQSWKLTGGPHMNSINSTVWSALDFQGPNSSGVVRAAQSGVVWRSSGCLNFIRVDHSDGWQTGYYHLLNERVSNGQTVSRGQALGDISTASGCGGSASGPHVHFSLRRNGVEQKIDGHDIGGWTVHNGTAQYNGYMVRVSDGARVNQWGTIYNDGSIGSGADTTPPTKASNVHPNGWTGPYTSDSTPSFMWNAAIDDDSGVAGYYVAVDDWTPEGGLSTDWWVGNVTTYTIPSALFDGQHFFAVTSKDNEGNRNPTNTNVQGDAPYYTFYVDTHSPSGSFNINNGDYVTRTTQVSIYSAVTDAVSGVVEMRLRNAGASWGNWQTYRSRVTHLLPATTGQNYTVEVQYRDRVGNTSSTYSQSILLNLYPDRPSSTNYNLLKSTTGNSVWNHQSNTFLLRLTISTPVWGGCDTIPCIASACT